MTAWKVLLLSEALGTPSHQHPWRDYSVAVLEYLRAAGADVTLVVERAFGFDAGGGANVVDEETRLTSVYGYLATGEHNPRLFYRGRAGRLLALRAPALLRFVARRQHRRAWAKERPIVNRAPNTTGLPERIAYLRNVARFVFPRRFYSSANLRAVYDTGPVEIDATGYDLVLIDGLLPIKVNGTAPEKIATILHDLAAITAPDTRMKARLIAGQALVCLARHGGSGLFANSYVRERFEALGVGVAPHRSIVLGPLAPQRIRALARDTSEHATSDYLTAVNVKSRKAAFIRAVSPTGILEQLVRDTLSGADGCSTLAFSGAPGEQLPTVTLMWPGGASDDLRPLIKLATDLAGTARVVAAGARPPEPRVPRSGLPAPKPVEIPLNLHLAGDLPERDRLQLMRDSALVIYPERTSAGTRLLEAVALDVPVLCFDTPINRIMLENARVVFVSRETASFAPSIIACLRGEPATPKPDRVKRPGSGAETTETVDLFRAILDGAALGGDQTRPS